MPRRLIRHRPETLDERQVAARFDEGREKDYEHQQRRKAFLANWLPAHPGATDEEIEEAWTENNTAHFIANQPPRIIYGADDRIRHAAFVAPPNLKKEWTSGKYTNQAINSLRNQGYNVPLSGSWWHNPSGMQGDGHYIHGGPE